MGTELQVRLTGLSAPGQLVDLAQPFPDLKSCWNACTSPEFMLWLSARLASTTEERRAVVSCLAELTRRAEHGRRHADPPVERAAGAAEEWLRSGASLDDLLGAAERRRARRGGASGPGRGRGSGRPGPDAVRSAPRQQARLLRHQPGARRAGRVAGRPTAPGGSRWPRRAPFARPRKPPAPTRPRRSMPGLARARPSRSARRGPRHRRRGELGDQRRRISRLRDQRAGLPSAGRRDDRAVRKAARLVRRRLPCPSFD